MYIELYEEESRVDRLSVPSPTLPPATTTNCWRIYSGSNKARIIVDPAATKRDIQNQLVEMKFKTTQRVQSLGVYWADDNIDVSVPKSWSLSYLKNGMWHPFQLYVTDFVGINKDMYVVVHPSSTLMCDGLRMSIQPQTGKQVGILDMDLDITN